jgi:hypothetical protein
MSGPLPDDTAAITASTPREKATRPNTHDTATDLLASGRQSGPERCPDVAAARDQDLHRDPVPRPAWRAMPRSMPLKTNRWTG